MTNLPFKEDEPNQCQNPANAISLYDDAILDALRRSDAAGCAEIAKVIRHVSTLAEALNLNNSQIKDVFTDIFSKIDNVETILDTSTDTIEAINTIIENNGANIEVIRQATETNRAMNETFQSLTNNLQTVTDSQGNQISELVSEIADIKTQISTTGSGGNGITVQEVVDRVCALANNISNALKAGAAKLNAYTPISCVYEAPTAVVTDVFTSLLSSSTTTTTTTTTTTPAPTGLDDLAPA